MLFFLPITVRWKKTLWFWNQGGPRTPHVKFLAHICIGRGRYPHACSSMPVNCPIKGFLFLESHTIEVQILTLLWEFGTFLQQNYVFTSTLCYSAKKIQNVTKRSSSILTLLWEFETFVQPNYVFTSTLCYSAKKIRNVTKRSSSILTLLWEFETFVQPITMVPIE